MRPSSITPFLAILVYNIPCRPPTYEIGPRRMPWSRPIIPPLDITSVAITFVYICSADFANGSAIPSRRPSRVRSRAFLAIVV